MMIRSDYLHMVTAALEAGEYRFARQSALPWLAAYPGDLYGSWLYAQALLGEGRAPQARSILASVCASDPEFSEGFLTLLRAEAVEYGAPISDTAAAALALNYEKQGINITWRQLGVEIPAWAYALADARRLLDAGAGDRGLSALHAVLATGPSIPLAGVTHLRLLDITESPFQARLNMAEFYHERWPACVTIRLLLANYLADSDETRAVALLHSCAVHDAGGQVPTRLWGSDHPYQALWPANLELDFDEPIPAAVAARLGKNLLASASIQDANTGEAESTSQDESDEVQRILTNAAEMDWAALSPFETEGETLDDETLGDFLTNESDAPEETILETTGSTPDPTPTRQVKKYRRNHKDPEAVILSKTAKEIGRPDLARLDGRFPVYVVLTTRRGLQSSYGVDGANLIEAALEGLVEAAASRPNWTARLLLADQPSSTQPLGFEPARPDDPWELKLALADLDAALAKHGERIGAVLIVGGPEIVPFHCLPNPVDDDDHDVASDNPYGNRDENYFSPEWPVGRLPGGAGKDPGLLIDLINRCAAAHRLQKSPESIWLRIWQALINALRPSLPADRNGFGYSAAAWQRASRDVFQPIQSGRNLWVSPPRNSPENNGNGTSKHLDLPPSKFGYFNLHGVVDGPEWFGQSDPLKDPDGIDYPVALRPSDLEGMNGSIPKVVFSEACYGAHLTKRAVDESIALKFLSGGTQVVVGSTSMAYGSIDQPLIAADLLGKTFWSWVRDGLPAGEALRRAKIGVIREMHSRQGFLGGEDQKTLLSFVLYGDPLAQPLPATFDAYKSKAVPRIPKVLKTVCDRGCEKAEAVSPSTETMELVRSVVSRYLPGMEGADMIQSLEHAECSGHTCPNHEVKGLSHPENDPGRRVITLSKKITETQRRYARLTLGADGKLVKLVVSR